ncbi:protein phosphatase 1 regulatory subunit 3G-like [Pseudorasbora parva]|uniref:protein phosphatase 1 regulatory subunit 3G-like n=1 Tax=Pseudorasbora parva TaxID=51549 RepID=UPI00351ED62A
MDIEQPEGTQTSDLTECLSEPEHTSKYDRLSPHSPKTPQTDRQRAKSLPVDLYQDESLSHKKCPALVPGKRVQFADMMGLNLTNVRHFDISDDANESSGLWHHPQNKELQHGSDLIPARLVPAFDMPVSLLEFDKKSSRLGVALESVTVTDSEVTGVIRVIHSNARREVGVRYTLNNWLTFSDIQAVLRLNEEKGLQWEQFDFILHTPLCFNRDSSVHFAVYCRTDLGECWDNNDGENYILKSACN